MSTESLTFDSTSPAPAAVPALCTTYREEFPSLYNLTVRDVCPDCGIIGTKHARQPPLPATAVPSLQGAVASNGGADVVTASSKNLLSPATMAFIKIKNELPKWTNKVTCKTFISSLTRTLTNSGIPQEFWYLSFCYVVEDESSAEWIQTNIIGPKLSWTEAKAAFISRFQVSDYSAQLRENYNKLTQSKGESVQSYSTRFQDVITQLDLEDDSTLVMDHFVRKLADNIKRNYYNYLSMKKADEPDFAISSLRRIIDICINFDVQNRTFYAQSGKQHDSSHSNDKSSSSSKKKWCNFHKTDTHETNECKANKNNKSSPSSTNTNSGSKPTSASSTSSQDKKKHVTCHKCGELGHYANDPTCPKNKGSAPPASGSASTSSSSKPSGSTSSTSNTSNNTTRSGRAVAPPDRYTPAANSITAVSSDVLPSSSVSGEPASVWFSVRDRVYKTLLDTGANVSCIDSRLAKELGLNVVSVGGKIKLANGECADRLGMTEPLMVTAIFPVPQLSLTSRCVTHSFELLPLDAQEYQFIIGKDLTSILFPQHIPLAFYVQPSPLSSVATPSPHPSICHTSVIDELLKEIDSGKIDASTLMNELSGTGALPSDEIPVKDMCVLSTPSALENEYAIKRQAIFDDPRIRDALAINDAITGFCTLPESEVTLHVDPSLISTLYRKQYPVPKSAESAVDECVQRWFDSGRIDLAPPNCPYNAALCVALKKDAFGAFTGFRICLDTRSLNKALVLTDKFQLPYIRNVLEQFQGCSIFGEFDLSEAYLQFTLHPDSRPYTAFTWKGRQFMFVGCPFGINLLPSYFQRIMCSIFHDLPYTCPYLDNLPFGSSTWLDHKEHAITIITRLNEANLKIKPSSIKMGHSEIRCLGHLLTMEGIAISPSKMSQIADWPLPKTGSELQSFLGFGTFIRHHIRHYADLIAALEAVKNHKVIEWSDALKEDFNLVKHAIVHAPVLQFADFSKPFHIATDASNTGVGGVLYQPDAPGGDITPHNIVSICSKKLQASQLNYPVYKKELWAIVYCLRQFHTYVWGRGDLIIFTDHKPLSYLLDQKELGVALQQWLDCILDYRFIIHYRPGILNVMPDALSRMYSSLYKETWGVPAPFAVVGAPLDPSPGDVSPRVATLTSLDAIHHIDTVLSDFDAHTASLQPIPSSSSSDSTSDGSSSDAVSVSQKEGGNAVALTETKKAVDLMVELEKRGKKCPDSEEEKVELIKKHHLYGHFGREGVFRSLFNNGFWWPHLRDDIKKEIATCDPCARYTVVKSGFNPASFITAAAPFDHIQIDTSLHLPASAGGYTALLVVIDIFTGFIILRPLKTNTAEIVAGKLWKIFTLFGLPKILQSDNGSEFANDVIRALVKLTGIDHRLISPYNPRADGKVERSIGTVMSIIKKHLHGTEKHWPLFVPFAQLSFNNKVSTLTNSSPFSLMFARNINEMKDYSNEPSSSIDLDEWREYQEKIISIIYPSIFERTYQHKNKMITSLNKKRHLLLPTSFPNGAIVMLLDKDRNDKFQPKYVGPYTVVRRTKQGNYVLKDATGDLLERIVPPDQMKLVSSKPRDVDTAGRVYEIQSILNHRGSPGSYQYLVKWRDYNDRTWEPEENFADDMVIRNYWKYKDEEAKGDAGKKKPKKKKKKR